LAKTRLWKNSRATKTISLSVHYRCWFSEHSTKEYLEMINLLPDETKRQLHAARTNVILVRYTGVILIAFLFLVFIIVGSSLLLAQSKASADLLVESNSADASIYGETQQTITELSSNLSGARALLDSRISYASFLRSLGSQMPAGTVIEAIELTPQSFTGSPVTLKVFAESAEATVALREQLQSSAQFSNINLTSISENGGIENYPVTASLSLTIEQGVGQ
jgi:Tfp pilus assembly protein PilN